MAKTKVLCVKFLLDVACQKLLKSANVSQSYSKNKSGTFFVDHGVGYLWFTLRVKRAAYGKKISAKLLTFWRSLNEESTGFEALDAIFLSA